MGYNSGMGVAIKPVYRVGVLGLGREGIDTLKFLNAAGLKPIGLDGRELAIFAWPVQRQIKRLTSELRLGPNYLAEINDLDIVFRSPGVPLNLPLLKKAKRRGVVMSSLMQIFFELCPAKIIGVTGTKGKSTTVNLIYHLLKNQLPGRVYLGGNVGKPVLTLLPKLTKKDWVTLELSSFQLEDLKLSPHISVLLNVSPEHLDRHHQFKKYFDAKSNIFVHQSKKDWLISSSDHLLTRAVLHKTKGKTFAYSTHKILPKGLYAMGGEIIYRHPKTKRRVVLCQRSQIPLLGEHNFENALAAIGVALLAGVKPAVVARRLVKFKSLPHRLELVGVINKTQFINDSMATTPIATMAALNTATEPVAVIIGGVSKRESLTELIQSLNNSRVNGIVLIGRSTPRLKREFKLARLRTPYTAAADLTKAVELAYRYVKSEGTVLLAPAFASFDMFKDAYDRGDQFRKIAKELIKQHK